MKEKLKDLLDLNNSFYTFCKKIGWVFLMNLLFIITSIPVQGDPRKTSVYAYNRSSDRYWKVTCPYLPAHYPGTGDTFTSVITGSLMQGDSLPIALDRATQFILQGIRATFGYEYDNREGILLEKVLHNLDMPIQISSYERRNKKKAITTGGG